jgi:hypothetical protein
MNEPGASPPGRRRKAQGRSLRVILAAFAAGLVFLAASILVNRLDRSGAGGNVLNEQDLPASSLDASNGAFWLLFLGEPESEGLSIERKAASYGREIRKLERVERLTWQAPPRTRPLGVRYWQTISDVPFPSGPEGDWPGFLRSERVRLTGLRTGLAVLLGRYERMIRCPSVADFGYRYEWDRAYALSSFVRATARLHAALCLLDAQDGGWVRAFDELRAGSVFGQRLMAAAQTLFFHNLGRSLVEAALEGFAVLLNLPGCPSEIAASLRDALPPSPALFSARSALLGEFLWASERIEHGDRWLQGELALRELLPAKGGDRARLTIDLLLGRELGPETYVRLREAAFEMMLQKNRTKAYFREALDWLVALDTDPPFKWGAAAAAPPDFSRLDFGWLWNPSGKLLYESFGPVRQKRSIERDYLARALHDLVRIAATLRLAPSGARPEETDPGVRDPFSGRPYRWDAERSLLWSVGVDGKDDQGRAGADLILPVRVAGR